MLATGALELTNNADGTFTSFNRSPSDGEEHTESGEWEVVESDGATHTIRTTQLEDSRGADEVDGTPSDVDLEFLDRNTLLLSSDEGGQTFSVQMTRQ